MAATADACANLALVKYWGKRDPVLNLPSRDSISVALDELSSRTTVVFDAALERDRLDIDGAPADPGALARTSRVLDLVRARAQLTARARVVSRNTFPYAAGLASSASGMAALAMAAAAAAGLDLGPEETAILARHGSGSATRSIHGGFVLWPRGVRADGADSHGVPLYPADHWDLRVLVAITDPSPKATSSRAAMAQTAATSPFYDAFVRAGPAEREAALAALRERDFALLGQVAEASAVRLHATAMTAAPPVFYWNPVTFAVLTEVRRARECDGLAAYASIDAGPQVKVLTLPATMAAVRDRLAAIPGVRRVIRCRVGGPARICPTELLA